MSDRTIQIAALSIALAFQAFALCYLSYKRSDRRVINLEEENVVEVEFIKQIQSHKEVIRNSSREKYETTKIKDGREKYNIDLNKKPRNGTKSPNSQADINMQLDIQPSQEKHINLNHFFDTTTLDFKPNLLKRRINTIQPTQEIMKLKMNDQSIGGRLRAMTKVSICEELRRSLINSPESTRSILAAMDENECH